VFARGDHVGPAVTTTSGQGDDVIAGQMRLPVLITAVHADMRITQEQLAERLNTTKPQISRLEKKEPGSLQQGWLFRIADVLECHWAELVEDNAPVTSDEAKLLEKIRGLSEAQRGAISNMVDVFDVESEEK